MDDSTNLCLACGLCCDGTVIGFVQLGREELPAYRDMMDVENSNGEGFFLQPCKKFCDGCTIYTNRPKQCAKYECALLKALDEKELAFDAAVEITKEVKLKKIALQERLDSLQIKLHSQSFYFQMAELNKLLLNNGAELLATQDHLALRAELNQLDSLLSSKFGGSMF
ncbi:hypothetical protein EFA69_17680 [Rufibacter immobilis]|uniref:YkgJ family cysteine cluster protein n=1 Tax=Rufibacter immobilis TaxID=1348778 RepID=A0A3M9MT61_9BACT|nr:YkgJ family cysteine cluster protein [Rufibacter immobilis]RNI27918.1 hypothetical protein EFA69_17680 [Rufibacter immobilis]